MHGVTPLRRKLRRMPATIQREVQDVLRDGANRIARDARSFAPYDKGDLRDSIETKLSNDKLSVIIGPGASAAEIVRRKSGSAFRGEKVKMRKGNLKLYFLFLVGYWLEFGTKGSAKYNVPAQSSRPFMRPAYDINRGWLQRAIRKGVDAALNLVAKGG